MDIDLDIYNLEELMSLSDRINESIRRKKSHIYSNEYIEELESLSEKLVKYILENITYINDESLKIEYAHIGCNICYYLKI